MSGALCPLSLRVGTKVTVKSVCSKRRLHSVGTEETGLIVSEMEVAVDTDSARPSTAAPDAPAIRTERSASRSVPAPPSSRYPSGFAMVASAVMAALTGMVSLPLESFWLESSWLPVEALHPKPLMLTVPVQCSR